jgi:hypothetical protein
VVANIHKIEKDYKCVLISVMVGEDTDQGRKFDSVVGVLTDHLAEPRHGFNAMGHHYTKK